MEIIRITGLEKTFHSWQKNTPILQGVNLSVQAGEIYGFLGANGVGKTTLLKCIFQFITHDAGSIELFGTRDYYHQKYFSRIGYAPEVTNLYAFLTGRELLAYMAKLANNSKLKTRNSKSYKEKSSDSKIENRKSNIDLLLGKL